MYLTSVVDLEQILSFHSQKYRAKQDSLQLIYHQNFFQFLLAIYINSTFRKKLFV